MLLYCTEAPETMDSPPEIDRSRFFTSRRKVDVRESNCPLGSTQWAERLAVEAMNEPVKRWTKTGTVTEKTETCLTLLRQSRSVDSCRDFCSTVYDHWARLSLVDPLA